LFGWLVIIESSENVYDRVFWIVFLIEIKSPPGKTSIPILLSSSQPVIAKNAKTTKTIN
jgi:hypothetical protein